MSLPEIPVQHPHTEEPGTITENKILIEPDQAAPGAAKKKSGPVFYIILGVVFVTLTIGLYFGWSLLRPTIYSGEAKPLVEYSTPTDTNTRETTQPPPASPAPEKTNTESLPSPSPRN